MERLNIDILGLSETHWREEGNFTTHKGNMVYFIGPQNESRKGVGFIIRKKLKDNIAGYNPINERIITIRIRAKPVNITIIQIYAPTADATEEELDEFYNNLSNMVELTPNKDILVIQGDFNAKIGKMKENELNSQNIGRFGLGSRNQNGERMLDFCIQHEFVVMNTCFEQPNRRLYTWVSPGGKYRNQIDYVMIKKRWRTSIKRVKTYPGADCGSDHQLLISNISIKLQTDKRKTKSDLGILILITYLKNLR